MLVLQLRELSLKNYRNYDNLELYFHSDLILFIGPNAQGKTNILESVFLSCTGRSHRTPRDRELIKLGEEEALIRTRVEKELGSSEISILLNMRDKKKVLINKTPAARLGELMGHLNSVLFSPDDLKLVRDGPAERRRFMDMELSQIRPRYFYYLQQYNRILTHRNNLLKEIQGKPSLASTLPVWDYQLAEAEVYNSAKTIVQPIIAEYCREIHSRITNHSEALTMEYKSSIPFEEGSLQEIQEQFIRELETRHKDDIARGSTGRGCHRDDIHFKIMDRCQIVRLPGSEEDNCPSLNSELEFMYKETGNIPCFADDALSELDRIVRKCFLNISERFRPLLL